MQISGKIPQFRTESNPNCNILRSLGLLFLGQKQAETLRNLAKIGLQNDSAILLQAKCSTWHNVECKMCHVEHLDFCKILPLFV